MNDAKAIADKLEIEYHVVDYKEKFKSEVISKFIKEYTDGKTPNPCNICNRFVKFNGLLEYAKSIGAKYIATGHYANIEYDDSTGRYYIKRACRAAYRRIYGRTAKIYFRLRKNGENR